MTTVRSKLSTLRALIPLLFSIVSLWATTAHAEEVEENFGEDAATCDFNHDGYIDLAVGAPNEDVGTWPDAGAVHVFYGGADGLQTTSPVKQRWTGATLGQGPTPSTNSFFGTALAAGDFNHDTFCDLAIGAPGQGYWVFSNAGMVTVLYGSSAGLTTNVPVPWPMVHAQQFDQDSAGAPGASEHTESYDIFGASLAAGDFNKDGFADLAIGVPGEDGPLKPDGTSPRENMGYVNIVYGSALGLQTSSPAAEGLSQVMMGVPFANEADDRFGKALTSGDFNNDGFADLAVGAPGEDEALNGQPVVDAGRVFVFYGNMMGLSQLIAGPAEFSEAGLEQPANMATSDEFGRALSAGDFDHDGFQDLAIGVPGDNTSRGSVNILYGAANGLSVLRTQELSQDQPLDIAEVAQTGDRFGHSLASADFNGDGYADLTIGVPAETLGKKFEAGFAHVIYGSAAGLSDANNLGLSQDAPASLFDASETGDHFGLSVGAGDFDADGYADLVIGVPDEDLVTNNVGLVHVLYGTGLGVTSAGSQAFSQDGLLPSIVKLPWFATF